MSLILNCWAVLKCNVFLKMWMHLIICSSDIKCILVLCDKLKPILHSDLCFKIHSHHQQCLMAQLVCNTRTISQPDNLWWNACLLFKNTQKNGMHFLRYCCNSRCILLITAEHITFWYDLYFCHLPLRSRQCKWIRGFRGGEVLFGLLSISTCHPRSKNSG